MLLSIITPCSRPLNLPTMYWSILNMGTNNVEWLIIYDSDKIDDRILQYEENIPIRLFNRPREKGDAYAAMLRNIGIENAKGDYLYFLDDDNLVHPKLYERILNFKQDDKILIFNQFDPKWNRRTKKFNIKNINDIIPGYIDTAQIVVPSKYKSRWDNNEPYFDEVPYLKNLIGEVGTDNLKWVDRLYTYRNYLRRYKI